ncbi:MAG: pSer/pThr/pTyr-binding forkhead associated (FHA) protein [Gammaproteobacteria bacterium]|jgi:pSer/pThr/pTyr-binding forkhead associated (FHA) protein
MSASESLGPSETIIVQFDNDIMRNVNSSATHIEIFFHGKEMSFSKEQLPIKLGRDEAECDIVVGSSVASRIHCVIEVRENQIGLIDKSTNGTFIHIGRNETFLIKSSFYPLIGQGTIKLGEKIDKDETNMVYFRMVTKTLEA